MTEALDEATLVAALMRRGDNRTPLWLVTDQEPFHSGIQGAWVFTSYEDATSFARSTANGLRGWPQVRSARDCRDKDDVQ